MCNRWTVDGTGGDVDGITGTQATGKARTGHNPRFSFVTQRGDGEKLLYFDSDGGEQAKFES